MKPTRTDFFRKTLSILLLAAAFFCFSPVSPTSGFVAGEREVALEEALHSALEHNERIAASRHRVSQAEEDVRIARSPMLPQVNLQGRHIRMKEIEVRAPGLGGPDRYNEASIQASQVLFQGGKLRSSLHASRYAMKSSRLEDYRTREQILFSVSGTYYNALFARRSVEIAENQLTRSNRQLELAESRREVGLVDMTAVLRARVQVAAAMEAIEEAKNNYSIALEQLALEMGIAQPPESIREPGPIELTEDLSVEQYIERAYENRRDLKASKEGLQAAMKQVDAQRGDFLPRLSLEGSYSIVDDDDVYYGDDYNWQAALVASYPLFTGMRDSAEVARARARQSEAEASVNRIKQEIRLDVRSAYADIQTRKTMVQHIDDQVESARANYEQVAAKFEEGLASTVDVVDAQTALNEAELNLANVYYRLQLDHLALKLAIGIFQEDLLSQYTPDNTRR